MTDKSPFGTMRVVLAPRGTEPVINLTRQLDCHFFGSKLVADAIDEAERRVVSVSELSELASPLTPLEVFAIQFLMRASGQQNVPEAEAGATREWDEPVELFKGEPGT